jgi:ABC-type spermidine/putrescine transport system permease subunit II
VISPRTVINRTVVALVFAFLLLPLVTVVVSSFSTSR